MLRNAPSTPPPFLRYTQTHTHKLAWCLWWSEVRAGKKMPSQAMKRAAGCPTPRPFHSQRRATSRAALWALPRLSANRRFSLNQTRLGERRRLKVAEGEGSLLMRSQAAVPPPEAAGALWRQKAQRCSLTLRSLCLGWSAKTAGRLTLEMRRRWRRQRQSPGGPGTTRSEVMRGGLHEGDEARAQLGRVTRPLTSLEDEQEVKCCCFFKRRPER